MTTNEYKEIESLLERFFEGDTTGAEEETLYRFFAGKDIPEEWMPYRPVMTYFREGIACGCASPRRLPASRRKRLRMWIWMAAAAGALLLLIPAGRLFLHREAPFDPYEGSCIIQNGVRITDMEIIRPELEATLQYVKEQQEEMEQLLASADQARQEATEMKEMVNRILQNEYNY